TARRRSRGRCRIPGGGRAARRASAASRPGASSRDGALVPPDDGGVIVERSAVVQAYYALEGDVVASHHPGEQLVMLALGGLGAGDDHALEVMVADAVPLPEDPIGHVAQERHAGEGADRRMEPGVQLAP